MSSSKRWVSLIIVSCLPLVSDNTKLEESRNIEDTNKKKHEDLVKLNESKNEKKRKRSPCSPYDSLYTVQYYGNVTEPMGKHIDITGDL